MTNQTLIDVQTLTARLNTAERENQTLTTTAVFNLVVRVWFSRSAVFNLVVRVWFSRSAVFNLAVRV